MSQWIYYPRDVKFESATITDITGTCTTKENMLNNRKNSVAQITTTSGAIYKFRIDLGSGVTSSCNFIALVNNNLFQETATIIVQIDDNDNAGLANPTSVLTSQAAVAADEPIWLEIFNQSPTPKRYYWVTIGSVSTAGYIGCLVMGTVRSMVDPSLPIETNRSRAGTRLNESGGGTRFETRRFVKRPQWGVNYTLINRANRDNLNTFFDDTDGAPFVFTDDAGTSLYYGRIIGDVKTAQDPAPELFKTSLLIEEEV
jgi:hypothetical protein